MRWLLATIQIVLASTFLVSGVGKWLRADDFAAALRSSHISDSLAVVLTWCVPVLEVTVAISLVWGSVRSVLAGTAAAAGLLLLFSSWIGWVIARRIGIRCGCFGASQRSVGLHSLARNLALLSLAIVAVWLELASANQLLPRPSVDAAISVTSIAMALSLLVAFRRARPAMVLTPGDVRQVPDEHGGRPGDEAPGRA